MSWLLTQWPFAFAVTVLVEGVVLLVVLRRELAPAAIVLLTLGVNLITHPVVWFLIPRLTFDRTAYLLGAEAFALVTETVLIYLLLRRRSISQALLASALANGASFVVGLALFFAFTGAMP